MSIYSVSCFETFRIFFVNCSNRLNALGSGFSLFSFSLNFGFGITFTPELPGLTLESWWLQLTRKMSRDDGLQRWL